MRKLPQLPPDPAQEEWEKPKTLEGWYRFFDRDPPSYRERLREFCAWQKFFCASDLAYIDLGVIERPPADVIMALEHAADNLDRDPRLLATLWALRGKLGGRAERWAALTRLMRGHAHG